MAWNLQHALMIGCNIVANALATNCRPIAPPGKKLTRYHKRATSCAPDAAITYA